MIVFKKVIRNVLYLKNTNINWHFIVCSLYKILLIKQNYKDYNIKLLFIIKNFET